MDDRLADVLPRINVLTQEQIEHIHAQSSQILASVGIRVDSERARAIFVEAGCRSNRDHIVQIPTDLVSGALQSVPSFVDIYDRLGRHAFRLGGSPKPPTRFGVGVTNLTAASALILISYLPGTEFNSVLFSLSLGTELNSVPFSD